MAGKVVGRATDDVQAAVASPSQVGFATTGALLKHRSSKVATAAPSYAAVYLTTTVDGPDYDGMTGPASNCERRSGAAD